MRHQDLVKSMIIALCSSNIDLPAVLFPVDV